MTEKPPPSLPARVGRRAVRIFGSFHLACAVLSLLFVVVVIGTLAQRSTSLFDVQQKYFLSWFFVVDAGRVPIPWPGGALLLSLLFVNLVVGGVLRMRIGKSTLGILIAHAGILTLLLGSFVEHLGAVEGMVGLYEGEANDTFENRLHWELSIYDAAAKTERVVPESALAEAAGSASRRLTATDLPFDVILSGWVRNAAVARAASPGAGAEEFSLHALPPDPEQAERNTPGAAVALVSKSGATGGSGGNAAIARGLLWAGSRAPFTAVVDGKTWVFDLRPQSFRLPFRVRLDRAVGKVHPGTGQPSEYSSYVTKFEGESAESAHITMNEPLRRAGYTLYQTSYSPADPERGEPRAFSGLEVVKNPTDRVPIVGCAIIAFGLVWHFLRKLSRHLNAQSTIREKEAALKPSAVPSEARA
jgi:hypothetical protein